ncbi:MAG: DNA-methyltransferase, partial [Candidatus Thorarchaeota archaeon]
IWEFSPASASKENHPAPFPEELPRRCIKLYSFVGDTVLDPFAGSGTTLKVARELGRNSIGYEINPDYYRLILSKVGQGKDWDDESVLESAIEDAKPK